MSSFVASVQFKESRLSRSTAKKLREQHPSLILEAITGAMEVICRHFLVWLIS